MKGEPMIFNYTETAPEMTKDPTPEDVECNYDNQLQIITEMNSRKFEPMTKLPTTRVGSIDDTKEDTEPEAGSLITVSDDCSDPNKQCDDPVTKITENRNAPLVEFKLDLKTHSANTDKDISVYYPPRSGNLRDLETELSPSLSEVDPKNGANMDEVHGLWSTDHVIANSRSNFVAKDFSNENNPEIPSQQSGFNDIQARSNGKSKIYNATCQIVVDSPNSIKIVGPNDLSSPYLSELRVSTIRPDGSFEQVSPYFVEDGTSRVDLNNAEVEMLTSVTDDPLAPKEKVSAVTGKYFTDQFTEMYRTDVNDALHQALEEGNCFPTSRINLDDPSDDNLRTCLVDLNSYDEQSSINNVNNGLISRSTGLMDDAEGLPSNSKPLVDVHYNDTYILVNVTTTVAPDCAHKNLAEMSDVSYPNEISANEAASETSLPGENSSAAESSLPPEELNKIIKTIAGSVTQCLQEFLGNDVNESNMISSEKVEAEHASEALEPFEQGVSKSELQEPNNSANEEHIEGETELNAVNEKVDDNSAKTTCKTVHTEVNNPTISVKVVSPTCGGAQAEFVPNSETALVENNTTRGYQQTEDATYSAFPEVHSITFYRTMNDNKQKESPSSKLDKTNTKLLQKPGYAGKTSKYVMQMKPSLKQQLVINGSNIVNPKLDGGQLSNFTNPRTKVTTIAPNSKNIGKPKNSQIIKTMFQTHSKLRYPVSENNLLAKEVVGGTAAVRSDINSLHQYKVMASNSSYRHDPALDYERPVNVTVKTSKIANPYNIYESHSLSNNKLSNQPIGKNGRFQSGVPNNLDGYNKYMKTTKGKESQSEPQPTKVLYVPNPKKPSMSNGAIVNNDDITKLNATANKKAPYFSGLNSNYNSLPKNSKRFKITSLNKIPDQIKSNDGSTNSYYPNFFEKKERNVESVKSEPVLRSVTIASPLEAEQINSLAIDNNIPYQEKVPDQISIREEVFTPDSQSATCVPTDYGHGVIIDETAENNKIGLVTKRADIQLVPNVPNFFRFGYRQNSANFINGKSSGDSRVKKVPILNANETEVDNYIPFNMEAREPVYFDSGGRKGKGRKNFVNKISSALKKKPQKFLKMENSSERPILYNYKLKQPMVEDDDEINEADLESGEQPEATTISSFREEEKLGKSESTCGSPSEKLETTPETTEGTETTEETFARNASESTTKASSQAAMLPAKIQIPLTVCVGKVPAPPAHQFHSAAATHFKNISEQKAPNDTADQSKLWDNSLSPLELRQIQARNMMRYMDTSVSPCQDFYQYACGNWHKYHPIPADHGGFDTFEMLRENLDLNLKRLLEDDSDDSGFEDKCKEEDKITLELYDFAPNQTVPTPYFEEVLSSVRTEFADPIRKAKNLYSSCMKEQLIEKRGAKPLLHLLNELRGWPILGLDWDSSNFDLIWLLGQLRLYNNDLLVSEWIGPDIKNSDEYVIQLDQTSLGLPSREYFLSETSREYMEAYHQFLLDIVYTLGAPEDQAVDDVKEIIEFEIKLASITADPDDRRNLTSIYARLSLGELQVFLPQIDWIRYFEIVAERDIPITTPIVCYCMNYLQDLVNLVSNTRPRTLANYLLWRFVRHRVNNLDERFQNAKQKFYHLLFGREASPPRWQFCVAQVNSNLGMALGNLFVNAHFDEKSKNDTILMTRQLEFAFKNILMESDWLDDSTRSIAIAKVDAMRLRIGYPDIILNKQLLLERYKDIKVHPDYYFENSLSILRHLTRNEHQKIGKMVDKNMWNTAPAVVNAYYSRNKNQIMFPAGILQPPFYHQHFPKALNYGGIGVVIGHEITHGFDDKGRLFDKDGNLNTWWSDQATEKFRDKAKCIVDQYNSFVVPEVNAPLDGMTTQGENIADNGGIKQAFKAYQEWLIKHKDEPLPGFNASNNQLFFLNFAQVWCGSSRPEAAKNRLKTAVHSPGRFRVIGTLSNSYAFAQAYQCPAGSPMNPVTKCMVW